MGRTSKSSPYTGEGRGASYGDIRDFLEETYGVEVSATTISRVTDKILPYPFEQVRIARVGVLIPDHIDPSR